VEFNSFGPAVGRLGSDSSRGGPSRSRGGEVEARGAEPPLAPPHFNHCLILLKVLAITQPSYLHNLITVQPPRSTRSSSLVTLACPSRPTLSSLRITDRSFQFNSPRPWNQLPASLRQPRTNILQFCLTQFFEWHFSHWFHRLTTLIIHHPSTLSFQPENFPFLQILPVLLQD